MVLMQQIVVLVVLVVLVADVADVANSDDAWSRQRAARWRTCR
jgi:hypothetical protein